jgi:mannose-6-phosphate isomerase-like protein (cupin superfamily)
MSNEIIKDPLFRQSYRFSRDGDVLRVEIWAEPGGGVLAEHVHPRHEERYEVLEGEVTFHVDRKPLWPRAGEPVVVPAGVRHRFENTGKQVAHLLVEAEPALALRESIQDGAELARIGRFTAGGKPRSLRALVEVAALAARYRETVVLTSPPPAVQRLLFPLLARFAARKPEHVPVRAS